MDGVVVCYLGMQLIFHYSAIRISDIFECATNQRDARNEKQRYLQLTGLFVLVTNVVFTFTRGDEMTDIAQEDMVQAVYSHAAELMRNGVRDSEIIANLVEQGLESETAEIVVNNLIEMRAKQKQEQGQKNMGFGALWCIGGTVVTVATYNAASGGGHYVVAWGAIVFGAVQFLQGLSQYTSANR